MESLLRKNNFLLPIGFAVALILGLEIGLLVSPSAGKPSLFGGAATSDADEVLQYIRDNYADTVNTDALMQGGIREMLSRLDPHSSFIPAAESKRFDEEIDGHFEGVGLRYTVVDDTIFIVSVIPSSPCEHAGILPGDRLISANDTVIAGKKLPAALIPKRLRGPAGSVLKLGVLRPGENSLRSVHITRGNVPVNSVDAAYMLNADVGYIKLEMFSGNTAKEVHAALQSLLGQGMKKLVFDLRDNGGGLLDQAVAVVDEFLEQHKLIVYTEGRASQRLDYESKTPGLFEQQPLAVLIDEGSASASEIMAGALQDWDRATLFGRRSFGKGLVQNEFKLRDGSTLKLTVAKYYTPSGRCIQKPYNKNISDYYEEVDQRSHDGELYNRDSIRITDTTRYHTKHGRIVYGGGGIIPDVFVPKDSARLNLFLIEAANAGLAEQFVYKNYGRLIPEHAFSDIATLQKVSIITDDMYAAFVKFCKLRGIHEAQYAQRIAVKGYFIHLMKSYLAQLELGDSGYYAFNNLEDKTLQKAIDQLGQ